MPPLDPDVIEEEGADVLARRATDTARSCLVFVGICSFRRSPCKIREKIDMRDITRPRRPRIYPG
jgi:hypothetical protein